MDAGALAARHRFGAPPRPALSLLEPLTDDRGVRAAADRNASYRASDNGRALRLAVDLSRQQTALHLAELSLAQLISTHRGAGHFATTSDVDDALALRGIATASAHAPWPSLRTVALQVLNDARDFAAESREAAATATIAATVVLNVQPTSAAALMLLANNRPSIGTNPRRAASSAVEIEALVLLAIEEDDDTLLSQSLSALDDLADLGDLESSPPELSAIADACAAAFSVTGDARWAGALLQCAHRFRAGDQRLDGTAESMLCALNAFSQAYRAHRRRRTKRPAPPASATP